MKRKYFLLVSLFLISAVALSSSGRNLRGQLEDALSKLDSLQANSIVLSLEDRRLMRQNLGQVNSILDDYLGGYTPVPTFGNLGCIKHGSYYKVTKLNTGEVLGDGIFSSISRCKEVLPQNPNAILACIKYGSYYKMTNVQTAKVIGDGIFSSFSSCEEGLPSNPHAILVCAKYGSYYKITNIHTEQTLGNGIYSSISSCKASLPGN